MIIFIILFICSAISNIWCLIGWFCSEPKDDAYKEYFDLTPEELAELYTKEQLNKAIRPVSYRDEIYSHLRTAYNLACMKEAFDETE